MKQLLGLIILLSISTSYGATASLEEVRSCLHEIRTSPSANRDTIHRCYDKALPWAHSSSVQGKALYVQVLQSYLGSDSDRASFQSLTEKLADYYLRHLDAEITPQAVVSWNDLEISTVYDGVTIVEFYTSKILQADVALKKYAAVFENLEQRKLATERQAHYLYAALLSNGQWLEASKILKRFPALSSSPIPMVANPELSPTAQLGYYVVSPDLKTMTLKYFDRNNGPRIVISGFCHLAEDLVRALHQETEIAQIMKQHGLVINPNDFTELDFQKMDSLRKEFPEFEFHPVSSSGAWFAAGFNTFSSPSISFLKDGVVKYEIPGVSRYAVADFCRGLESIGLSAPKNCAN